MLPGPGAQAPTWLQIDIWTYLVFFIFQVWFSHSVCLYVFSTWRVKVMGRAQVSLILVPFYLNNMLFYLFYGPGVTYCLISCPPAPNLLNAFWRDRIQVFHYLPQAYVFDGFFINACGYGNGGKKDWSYSDVVGKKACGFRLLWKSPLWYLAAACDPGTHFTFLSELCSCL